MAKGGGTYKEVLATIRKKPLLPVYLLHGEEDFLLDMALAELLSAALVPDQRSLNLDVVDCADVDGREIASRALSLPMMGDRRVVVARNVERLSQRDLELVTRYVENPSESTTLVLTGKKADLRRKPFSTLNAGGAAFEFAPLNENRLPGWITERVRQKSATISEEAANLLAAYIGSSLREIESEIEKVLTYLGDRSDITVDDIAAVVGFSREFNVFQLQDAIGRGDTKNALNILDHMLDDGQGLPFIIVMLTAYFSSLWKLHHLTHQGGRSSQNSADYPKAWNWKRDEYLAALRRYPSNRIERAFRLMAETEAASRQSTGADVKDLLHTMLIQIMAD